MSDTANVTDTSKMNEQPSSYNVYFTMFKVIFYLIIIIGLFLVIIKFISRKNKAQLQGRSIHLLGGVALGQNKSVQIIEVGHSLYIVGVGDNVQLLDKIDEAEEVAYVLDSFSSVGKTGIPGYLSFPSLGEWLSKFRKADKQQDEEEITASFQQVFHDKMQHMTNRKTMVEHLLQQQKNTDRSNEKDEN